MDIKLKMMRIEKPEPVALLISGKPQSCKFRSNYSTTPPLLYMKYTEEGLVVLGSNTTKISKAARVFRNFDDVRKYWGEKDPGFSCTYLYEGDSLEITL